MANHWNIRRRVVQHADKIEDSKEVLKTFYVEITTAVKLHSYDDVAALRQQQKDARRLQLDNRRNLTAWVLDGEEDMA